jgi:hypothetical protein
MYVVGWFLVCGCTALTLAGAIVVAWTAYEAAAMMLL